MLALSVLSLNLDIHRGLLFLIGIFILISLYHSLKKSSSVKFKDYIKSIEFRDDLQCKLIHSNNQSSSVELQSNWFKLSWLLILNFRLNESGKRYTSIIILPDMLHNERLRQLKLHLLQSNLSKKD